MITDPKVDIDRVRRQMGMVFQHFNLFPNMTIRKNITLAPVRTGLMNQTEANDTATALLRRVGLEEKGGCLSRTAFRWPEAADRHCPRPGHEAQGPAV